VIDTFENYLMYRPSGMDSIWVTLSVFGWYWGGTASRGPGGWALNTGISPTVSPTGSNSVALPAWDDYFTNSDFLP
jgi:hypothetical protein